MANNPRLYKTWCETSGNRDKASCDIVYCDGACKGNGSEGSTAGIGVWWGMDDSRNISERCPGSQTNNRAELIAIARALETAPRTKRPLLIKTDSQYSISSLGEWIDSWIKYGWKNTKGKPIKNAELIRYLIACIYVREQNMQKVLFEHVKGHSGEEGNEGADKLAVNGTSMPPVEERDWVGLKRMVESGNLSTEDGKGASVRSGKKTPKPTRSSEKVASPGLSPVPKPSSSNTKSDKLEGKGPRGVKRSYEVVFGAGTTIEEVAMKGSKVVVRVRSSPTGTFEPVSVTPVPEVDPSVTVTNSVSADEIDLRLFDDALLNDDELEEYLRDDDLY